MLNNYTHHTPHGKLHMAPFRAAIASKLKELKVGTSHTNVYVKQMRTFYDEIFALSNGTEAAGGVM